MSSARYNPSIDEQQGVDRDHSWPASHCARWIDQQISARAPAKKRKRQQAVLTPKSNSNSAIGEAVAASNALPLPATSAELSTLWLSRVCKTASHELGHCFGIDHCTYFACIMQGTASIVEDARQPPYLCPVDLSKVLRATRVDENARYVALLEFCENYRCDRTFSAFAAWLKLRIADGYRVPF